MTEPISITDKVVDTLTKRLGRTERDLRSARADLFGLQEEVGSGAGEFAHAVADHIGDFQRVWRDALETHAESAAALITVTQAQQRDAASVDGGR